MSDEYEIYEERSGIMGKITVNIPNFKHLCEMGRENGFAFCLLNDFEELKKAPPLEKMKKLLKLIGESEFIDKCDVLTRLSGIQGDIRKSQNMKGMRDELNARIYGSTTDNNQPTT